MGQTWNTFSNNVSCLTMKEINMKRSIMWFRYDLRLYDNVALAAACEADTCYPIFIFDENSTRPIGEASSVWLHHALISLNKSLQGSLSLFKGDSISILQSLTQDLNISEIHVTQPIDPQLNDLDNTCIENSLKQNCLFIQHEQHTLWNIDNVRKNDGTPFKVFSPFYRKGCAAQAEPDTPIDTANISNCKKYHSSTTLTDICPLPSLPWANDIIKDWDISEEGAQSQWKTFIKEGLPNYKQGRNFPNKPYVSRLSPYIHHGQISIRQLFHDAKKFGQGADRDHFISELGWREFSYYLLHHFPSIRTKNFQPKFDKFPWTFNETFYKAWCKGETGYPIVDAGMRELYQTGFMHNRVRMICGSFLVKNLLIDWRYGEKWYWNCLFDADIASNTASWQWVAGTGADAAPYFRIFNPILQGEKFDPDGSYTKKYIPELKYLSKKYLFQPWEAPQHELKAVGIELGKTYPKPIIDYKESRDIALAAFSQMKES